MKKTTLLIAAAVMALLASSCRKDEVVPVTVSVSVDESALVDVPLPESYEVTLTNLSTAETRTATTENLSATFASIVPGLYSVSVLSSASEDGIAYYYSGSLASVNFSADGQKETVAVSSTESSALVLKEIYYTNSGDYYIREQFYEVYNNSTATVYLDGLCIAEAIYYNYDGVTPYNFEIENPENYAFVQYVWQIPGSGSDYPLAPGESVVIAQWATNHSLETLNPGSAIGDLSSAEFEALTGASTTYDGMVLTDNAAINMLNPVSAYSRPQWMTTSSGASMIIFYPEGELNSNNMIAAEGLYGGAREIPLEWIVDGVNCIADETKLQNRTLPDLIDAGALWCSAAYSGESLARKVAETRADGTVVYMDTNNTSNDFEVMTKPEIRRNGAKIPSWNTWAN